MARLKGTKDFSSQSIFVQRFREIMNDTNTTQKALAEALDTTPQSISQYATGQSEPAFSRLKEIADYFNVTADWLIGITNDRSRIPSAADEIGLSGSAISDLQAILNAPPQIARVYASSLEKLFHSNELCKNLLIYLEMYYLVCKEPEIPGHSDETHKSQPIDTGSDLEDIVRSFFSPNTSNHEKKLISAHSCILSSIFDYTRYLRNLAAGEKNGNT